MTDMDNGQLIRKLIDDYARLTDDICEERELRCILFKAVLDAQWGARKVFKGTKFVQYCPVCRQSDDKGHKNDCSIKIALDAVEKQWKSKSKPVVRHGESPEVAAR